jgi:hypothetical protein
MTDADYEFGAPPEDAVYIIEADGEGYLMVMSWMTPDGKEMNMSYQTVPDGQEHDIDNPAADTLMTERIDPRTLDSTTRKNGDMIAYARRELSEDYQTMKVIQSGHTPDGDPFSNVSFYRRSQ